MGISIDNSMNSFTYWQADWNKFKSAISNKTLTRNYAFARRGVERNYTSNIDAYLGIYYINSSSSLACRKIFSIDVNAGVTYHCYNSQVTLTIAPIVKLKNDVRVSESSGDGSKEKPWKLEMLETS